jgi:glycosyltransferase involved in cell wall biosynthesis
MNPGSAHIGAQDARLAMLEIQIPDMETQELELTILMPCLNEAETIEACVRKAQNSLQELGIHGEVLVADNGSTDGSQELARKLSARVIDVPQKGYGAALRGGIAAAKGRYVIMGDADDSYAFDSLAPFVERLREGYDLVMGNRFKGGIQPGAMPFLHRYLGNPVLSLIGRRFFSIPIGDFHCGLRGFRRDALLALGLRTDGMEFASEMIIRSALAGVRMCEVPTTLKPDGRSRPPHLRTWRDGWRHLRFMLLHSPRWLFLYPGLALMGVSLLATLWLLPQPRFMWGLGFDIHTLLYVSTAGVVGLQLSLFAILARTTAACLGALPRSGVTTWLLTSFRLEAGIACAGALLIGALVLAVKSLTGWGAAGFAELNPSITMRLAIPASVLSVAAIEVLAASFWITFLQFADTRKSDRAHR